MRPQENWGGMRETVLWTNPAPTSTFTNGNVTLSDSIANYDYIRFYCRGSTSISTESSVMMPVSDFYLSGGSTNKFKASVDFTTSSGRFDRCFSRVNDTTVEIPPAYQVNNAAINNTLLIPLRITGIKM